jgi:dolichol-phosphate mannosyltransferase
MKKLIVIPTFNERKNIARLLAGVRGAAPDADVVVVDDNSPDRTGELAEQIARDDARVRVVHRPVKLGLGTAYCEAFGTGISDGYGYLVQMDADLAHDPAGLPAFFRALDEGADVVIGSRHMPGGRIAGWSPERRLLSQGGGLYARTILGVDLSDPTSGYRAYTRRALDAIEMSRVYSCGYAFQIEMVYRAIQRGMRVREIPIEFTEQTGGHSRMGGAFVLDAAASVWKMRLSAPARPARPVTSWMPSWLAGPGGASVSLETELTVGRFAGLHQDGDRAVRLASLKA